MAYGARDFAGEPLYWAVARLIARGGMSAVTVRAAAAEAGCSVGFMRHYYDVYSLLAAPDAITAGALQSHLVSSGGFSDFEELINEFRRG